MFCKLKCPSSVTGRFPNNAQASEGQLLNKLNHSYKVLLQNGTLETFEAESSELRTLSLRSQAHGKPLIYLTTWQHPQNPASISAHQCKMTSKMRLNGQFYLSPGCSGEEHCPTTRSRSNAEKRQDFSVPCSFNHSTLNKWENKHFSLTYLWSILPIKSPQTLKASCRCDSDVIPTSLF